MWIKVESFLRVALTSLPQIISAMHYLRITKPIIHEMPSKLEEIELIASESYTIEVNWKPSRVD